MNSFTDYGLISSLLKTLKDNRLNKPTEIQSQTIPILMGGSSVVGVAETGSGKTLAYALPILNALKSLENEGQGVESENAPRAIVLVPTSELGEQVSKVFKMFTHDTRLRVRPALGGMKLLNVRKNAEGPFEILIATPGRLVQLIERRKIDLSDVRMIIFDEADQMMDQGFLKDSSYIAESCPAGVQMALFSATISTAVQELLNQLFADAEVIRSKGSGKVVSTLTTQNIFVEDGKRWPVFEKVLKNKIKGGTIIFTNTREQCDKLTKEMTEKGYNCVIYRGEMDKNQRRQNLKYFREGKADYLIATDLAGRGLDIESVAQIINFHLPKQHENYLHRVGRTARAGRKGLVINLVTERDAILITKISGKKPHFKKPGLSDNSNSKTGAKSQGKSQPRSLSKSKPQTKEKFDTKATSKSKVQNRPSGRSAAKHQSRSTASASDKGNFGKYRR
jgi:ATP-dependent RNA helicase RhlE